MASEDWAQAAAPGSSLPTYSLSSSPRPPGFWFEKFGVGSLAGLVLGFFACLAILGRRPTG